MNTVIERLESDPDYLKSHWSLPREDARFLYLLARIGGFRRMLEVGTSVGYSTLHLAQAASAQNAHVTTIDASAERQAQALSHLREAGLDGWVNLLHGDALTVLKSLQAESQTFDLMFIDARKSEYLAYMEMAEQLLGPGGVLLADNTRSHRKQMANFIEAINASPGWETSDLETPNGFVLARKREARLSE
ncbi:MAG: putative O-methyltransferase [Vampirovibrio sp.]|jgi:predicted O-methyltransferase YrrM|nr:putative O-methyltransferase [Vampirovibrio sp.]